MKTAAIVLGYHGCDRDVGEAILVGEKALKPSKNQHDWLGRGRLPKGKSVDTYIRDTRGG